MPYRRKRRYRSKSKAKKRSYYGRKKAYYARKNYRRGVSKIPRIRFGGSKTFPQKLNTILTYNDTDFELTTALGNSYNISHLFSGNSIYDPDHSGVGIQPYYYDQLAAVYNRYQVYASKITIYMTSGSSADTSRLIQTSLVPFQLTSITDDEPNDLRNLSGCRQIAWNEDRNDNKRCKLKAFWKSKYTFNQDDQDQTASISGNPTLRWYWHLYQDTSTMEVGTTIHYDVKIKYYCRFYKRGDINES